MLINPKNRPVVNVIRNPGMVGYQQITVPRQNLFKKKRACISFLKTSPLGIELQIKLADLIKVR
jgi:hypothetical protein